MTFVTGTIDILPVPAGRESHSDLEVVPEDFRDTVDALFCSTCEEDCLVGHVTVILSSSQSQPMFIDVSKLYKPSGRVPSNHPESRRECVGLSRSRAMTTGVPAAGVVLIVHVLKQFISLTSQDSLTGVLELQLRRPTIL
jgi:hypothetical protein